MKNCRGIMDIFGQDSSDNIAKHTLTKSLLHKRMSVEPETMTTELKMHNSIMGNLQTRFEANKYFVHTFVHMTSGSFLYEMLKIRNYDQLLCWGNEDATLLSHNEVLTLLETFFNTTDKNILMLYWRPGANHISATEFNETISECIDELDGPETETERKSSLTITINKCKSCKYLQLSGKKLVFSELISAYSDTDICDFNQCHFQEERTFKMEAGRPLCIRRFKYKGNNNYLYVAEEGFITLDAHKSSTFEIIPNKAFSLLKECQSGRYLCVNRTHENGQFVILDNIEDIHDDSFKFNIKKKPEK